MRYWWVNQNQTFRQETRGNFMWSPKVKLDGTRNPFYDFMQAVVPGDVVFSFCDALIKTVGIVTGRAQTAPKPDFGNAGSNWANEGWYVPVYYVHLQEPLRPADHMPILTPLLPERYAPLQPNGRGNQGVYLTELSETLAEALIVLMGHAQFEDVLALLTGFPATPDPEESDEVPSDVGPTVRDQIIKARRGQGIFRSIQRPAPIAPCGSSL